MELSAADLTSRIVRHERAIIWLGLALLIALSWWWIASGAGLAPMDMGAMEPPPLGALILMWWLMMLAMMLPSAAPAILLYARVRQQHRGDRSIVQPWVFAFGYGATWLGFSIAAAMLQRMIATPAMKVADPRIAGAMLIAAGVYQLSPAKNSCLRQCRSPAQFLTRHWRAGMWGAVRLGALHGIYCVGCCWMLMVLLFVGGVMNVAWIIALTLIVAIEKLLPHGEWVGRVAGSALIAWGLAKLAGY